MKMHLNFAARDGVVAAIERLRASGYAVQNKKTYFVLAETEARGDEAASCCIT